MSLRRALFLVVAVVLVIGVVPAGLLLSRQLERTLVDRTHDDLHRAGMVLADRWAAVAGARMMHAQELSRVPGLAEALVSGDEGGAEQMVSDAAAAFAELPILISPDGQVLAGSLPAPMELLAATERGEMPVAVVGDGPDLHLVALAPVKINGVWLGAAGGATPFTEFEAATLSGLTRSDVVIVAPNQSVAASSAANVDAPAIAQRMADAPLDSVQVIEQEEGRLLALAAPVVGDARVLFVRGLAEELAVLPALRGTAFATTAAALLVALLMGSLFAGVVARPVGELASAADRLAAGDDDVPVKGSAITEVNRMAEAFDAMRLALAARVDELEAANQELSERQERLTRLQVSVVSLRRRAHVGDMPARRGDSRCPK